MARLWYLDQLDASLQGEVRDLLARLSQHDKAAGSNALKVAQLAEQLARQMGMDDLSTQRLCVAALLHDIGKLHMSTGMLQWPTELDDKQWKLMCQHINGTNLLSPDLREHLGSDVEVITNHHPYYFPNNLDARNGTNTAELVGIVSAYVAMTNDSYYRPAMSSARAIGIIKEEVGTFWSEAAFVQLGKLFRTAQDSTKPHSLKALMAAVPRFAEKPRILVAAIMRKVGFPSPGNFVSRHFLGQASPLQRAWNKWDQDRVRMVLPVVVFATVAIVAAAVFLPGGNGPLTASAGGNTAMAGGGDMSPPLESGEGQTDSTIVEDTFSSSTPETTTVVTAVTDTTASGTPTTGTTAKSATSPTTGTTVTASTVPTTTTTTKATTTTIPATTTTTRASPPSGSIKVIFDGCTFYVDESNAGNPSTAMTWIRAGDGCSKIKTSAYFSGVGTTVYSTVKTLGTARYVRTDVSGTGELGFGVSFHYVKTNKGTCARTTLFIDNKVTTVSGSQYCP